MVSVNIRQFTHHFSKYLKDVKEGQRLVLLERNVPIADIVPHDLHISRPGWKRPIKKVKVCGESFSRTIVKNRKEENR